MNHFSTDVAAIIGAWQCSDQERGGSLGYPGKASDHQHGVAQSLQAVMTMNTILYN